MQNSNFYGTHSSFNEDIATYFPGINDKVFSSVASPPSVSKETSIPTRIDLLLHSNECRKNENLEDGEIKQCKVPNCSIMKLELNHADSCQDGIFCSESFCYPTKQAILHLKNCTQKDCPFKQSAANNEQRESVVQIIQPNPSHAPADRQGNHSAFKQMFDVPNHYLQTNSAVQGNQIITGILKTNQMGHPSLQNADHIRTLQPYEQHMNQSDLQMISMIQTSNPFSQLKKTHRDYVALRQPFNPANENDDTYYNSMAQINSKDTEKHIIDPATIPSSQNLNHIQTMQLFEQNFDQCESQMTLMTETSNQNSSAIQMEKDYNALGPPFGFMIDGLDRNSLPQIEHEVIETHINDQSPLLSTQNLTQIRTLYPYEQNIKPSAIKMSPTIQNNISHSLPDSKPINVSASDNFNKIETIVNKIFLNSKDQMIHVLDTLSDKNFHMKQWHLTAGPDIRKYSILIILKGIFRTVDVNNMRDPWIQNLIQLVLKHESHIYKIAESMCQYSNFITKTMSKMVQRIGQIKREIWQLQHKEALSASCSKLPAIDTTSQSQLPETNSCDNQLKVSSSNIIDSRGINDIHLDLKCIIQLCNSFEANFYQSTGKNINPFPNMVVDKTIPVQVCHPSTNLSIDSTASQFHLLGSSNCNKQQGLQPKNITNSVNFDDKASYHDSRSQPSSSFTANLNQSTRQISMNHIPGIEPVKTSPDTESRQISILKIMHDMCPTFDTIPLGDPRMTSFVTYAVTIENGIYKAANSKEEYHYLLAEKMKK